MQGRLLKRKLYIGIYRTFAALGSEQSPRKKKFFRYFERERIFCFGNFLIRSSGRDEWERKRKRERWIRCRSIFVGNATGTFLTYCPALSSKFLSVFNSAIPRACMCVCMHALVYRVCCEKNVISLLIDDLKRDLLTKFAFFLYRYFVTHVKNDKKDFQI